MVAIVVINIIIIIYDSLLVKNISVLQFQKNLQVKSLCYWLIDNLQICALSCDIFNSKNTQYSY